jgi:hypothetical protein
MNSDCLPASSEVGKAGKVGKVGKVSQTEPERLDVDDRYSQLRRSDDPCERELAHKQATRLRPKDSELGLPRQPESRRLAELISETVGPLHERASGDLEGSCPWHDSTSGRCLLIYREGTRWLCRSCRRGGDAVSWLVLSRGMTVRDALRFLGLPPRPLRRHRRAAISVRLP